MKIYLFYTQSHKILLDDWFLPSIKDEYNAELDITEFKQKCKSAKLNTDGWLDTMFFKIDTILKGINENIDNTESNLFIHSDTDIQFFGNFVEDCKKQIENTDYDILFQKGGRSICMGFFICKSNNKTKQFFEDIKQKMNENKKHDEKNAKMLLNIPHDYVGTKISFKNKYNIKWNYLTMDKYIGGTVVSINTEKNQFKPPPKNTIMHHATFTVGVPNKIKQLNYVKQYFQ